MLMIHPWAARILGPHRHEQESPHSPASHVKYRLKDRTRIRRQWFHFGADEGLIRLATLKKILTCHVVAGKMTSKDITEKNQDRRRQAGSYR
jgi:hypothetical protein